ncbi:hypothetical protein SCLCIDRAFT_12379 [Scleroderma citrinum Foug A]|uniref:Uncharacterized protein n=1 Tax=Scleroderma citrinum Foug A TaxID=1036808 RepID=A0A0C2YK87_9AGAM|nr:hypothetical protein SCLCIDRAFT_12379 [Scleroderma citrinum Foug A]
MREDSVQETVDWYKKIQEEVALLEHLLRACHKCGVVMCVPMVAAQVLEWVSVVEVAPVDLINYIGHINVLKVHMLVDEASQFFPNTMDVLSLIIVWETTPAGINNIREDMERMIEEVTGKIYHQHVLLYHYWDQLVCLEGMTDSADELQDIWGSVTEV